MQVKIKIWFYILLLFMISCNSRHEISTNDKIKVAVFSGNGASITCVLETLEALKIDQKIQGAAPDALSSLMTLICAQGGHHVVF